MTVPKFTASEIKAEIAKLEGSGFNGAVYYLKAELKRRQASSINAGRPITKDTRRNQTMREASQRYREKQKGEKL